MGDFLIDFRPAPERRARRVGSLLRFFDDMELTVIEDSRFTLVLTSPDEARLWAPSWEPNDSVSVALCGRVALGQGEWDQAKSLGGKGGLACQYLSHLYREKGLQGITEVSGNFVILILDQVAHEFHLVTDRWGLLPAFKCDWERSVIMSSHPDVLADAAGETHQLNLVSVAEFVLTCRLSPPFTYYNRIVSIPCGTFLTLDLHCQPAMVKATKTYYAPLHPDSRTDRRELALEFAAALKRAVSKRTLPILGTTAVALSGGLDSRTVLRAASSSADLIAFNCYDEENEELRIARRIAGAADVRFIPMHRQSDYYLDTATLGVKISGGMGCFASNHFLGFRKELKRLGVRNLLTGCYCDYLFKGLAFNKRISSWTSAESPGQFDFAYYSAHFQSDTALGRAVRKRLEELFPLSLRQYRSELDYADVERRRLFPLAYEEDNAERTIPQRVMGWFVPVAENDLLRVAERMSSQMKLNRTLFTIVAREICGPQLSRIPNANTGLPLSSGRVAEALSSHWRCGTRLLRRLWRTQKSNGSWLDWSDYVARSKPFRVLWERPNRDAQDLFRQVLGDRFSPRIEAYQGARLALLLQLFTLKLWLENRCGATPSLPI